MLFLTVLLYVVSIILGLLLLYQVTARIVRKLFHFPAPAFIGRFLDSDLRRRMQPPETIIKRSAVKKGMRVLELGCGSGAYTTFMARAVGKEGEVYALDIQEKMLDQIRAKLKQAGNADVSNIKLVLGDAYNLPFDPGFFDLVYIITVLQEIPEKEKALKEVLRVLKPGGLLAVSEFLPDPDYPLKSTTIKQLRKAGFDIEAAEGNFWTYTIRGKKAS